MRTHKHKGLLTSSGSLRMHPINRKHKDPKVQRYHNEALDKLSDIISNETKPKFNKAVMCPVDSEGFIYVDLTDAKLKQKGIRVKFIRKEGRKQRTVSI